VTQPNTITIRKAELEDVDQITRIFNHAIEHSTANFHKEAKSADYMWRWLASRQKHHPVLVAETEDTILGWASLGVYDPRTAFNTTAEFSVYVDETAQGQGVGLQLADAAIQAAKDASLHTIIARVTADNEASLKLHEKAGFQKAGHLKQVGQKFDRWLDVCVMQYNLVQ
jgi:phosphinothricin acetyltransferase